MPKSKKDKSRKSNLINFKNKQKTKNMSENIQEPKFRRIQQIPVWPNSAEFKLSGTQFLALQNFFNLFAEPLQVMQTVFRDNLESGTIQMRYQDETGNEISKEEVEQYITELAEFQKNSTSENDKTDPLTSTESETETEADS